MKMDKILRKIMLLTAAGLVINLSACGAVNSAQSDYVSAENESAGNADDDEADDTENVVYANDVPELYDGHSEYVGPWAYLMYARDESTSYVEHEYGDGYIPKAGDLIITGDDDDYWYFSDFDFVNATSLRKFPYGYASYVWNGHILYVSNVSESGILTCYEGNSIAPNQKLEADDPDYIHKSSIDIIKLDFADNTTITANKPAEKPIRVVIETKFSTDFVAVINSYAAELLTEFNEDPDSVRQMLMSYYVQDVDWCGLYLHHLLLTAKARYTE